MKALLEALAALLSIAGKILGGGDGRAQPEDGVLPLGHPDVLKLRSTHVDPLRTGLYFPWTKSDCE